MPELQPPIFLIGNVRSGTSMMHDLFDAHPDVQGWSEPRTLWTYADPRRKHDRFDASDATPRVQRYIRKQFLKRQIQGGGLRVMEKTPSNVLRIPYVHAIFPESKLLYIRRDPLANLSSTDLKWSNRPINRQRTLQRLQETPLTQLPWYASEFLSSQFRIRVLGKERVGIWGVRYPGIYDDLKRMTVEEVIAHQWVACVRQADEDLRTVDPDLVMRVRYEEFVQSPIDHFERISEHFGVRMTPEFKAHVESFVDPTRMTKWKRLDPDVLRRCVPIYREELAMQGYELPEEVRAIVDQPTEAPAKSGQ